jgi:hypothetical protein
MFLARSFSVKFWLYGALVVLWALEINALGQEEQPEPTPPPVMIHPASDTDFGFDLMHMEIVAEGRLPSVGTDYGYRVLSITDQGSCRDMCPATLVYVVVGKVSAKRDEKMKVYRIDGVRFMHSPKVTVANPDAEDSFFLAFRFTSMPQPRVTEHYVARIGSQGAVVERDGPDKPPPAHHFAQLFQRPGAGVFRITLKDGKSFRLQTFEIFDPEIYGQPDAWSAEIVESAAGNGPDFRMNPGTNYGPFLESEITEIFDEGLNETVFTRKD